jgi:hypothetical protein
MRESASRLCSKVFEGGLDALELSAACESKPSERDYSHFRFRQVVHRTARPDHGAVLLRALRLTTLMSASASSSLESLIHSIIPQSRSDQALFNDILSHCKDVLSRLARTFPWPSFFLTPHLEICSHIGQSHVRDIGHLTEIVKRRRTHWSLFTNSSPNSSGRLSHSESS